MTANLIFVLLDQMGQVSSDCLQITKSYHLVLPFPGTTRPRPQKHTLNEDPTSFVLFCIPILRVSKHTSKPECLLKDTRVDDGGLLLVADGTAGGTSGLKGLDVLHRVVLNLAEDDVAAIEPRSDDSGDEELAAVPVESNSVSMTNRLNALEIFVVAQVTYVLGPALAMDNRPGRTCFFWKFSSANFSP